MPELAAKVDLFERFMFLDAVMMMDRGGIQALQSLSGGAAAKPADQKTKAALENIDWDSALRNANKLYDRLVAAMRLKDRAAREKQFDQFDAEFKSLKKKVMDSGGLGKIFFALGSAKSRGTYLCDILIGLMVPAVRKVQQAEDRTEQLQANLHVAFALAAYHREHGTYPNKLDALAPKYLAKIPKDIFSGKPLIYRPTEKGYLLYSVGVNGKDDQGRGYEDDPPGDDLSVRMPLPRLPRK
jgi:hypothetical protein